MVNDHEIEDIRRGLAHRASDRRTFGTAPA
jgi:hypothetical protein